MNLLRSKWKLLEIIRLNCSSIYTVIIIIGKTGMLEGIIEIRDKSFENRIFKSEIK